MRIIHYVLLLTLFLTVSCKTKTHSPEVSACGVKDPVNNLPWLKQKVDDAKSAGTVSMLTIKKFEYKGNTYFHYYEIYMSCLYCIFFDCSGEQIIPGELFTEEEYKEFTKELFGPSVTFVWPRSLPRE